uniref:Uncharacterized protein n=1 Tax=Hucho hucho TaxID=62062 RepID=A0A4W5N5U1_9TELE
MLYTFVSPFWRGVGGNHDESGNFRPILDLYIVEEFPESFDQLGLQTHGHLIPRGACSLWPGDEEEEEEEGERSEEWYQQKEEKLKDRLEELMLWAAENNRECVTLGLGIARDLTIQCFHDA